MALGLLEQFVDFCGNLLMGNQHRFARIDFRHAPWIERDIHRDRAAISASISLKTFCWNPLRASRFHVRNTPCDFVVPGLRNGFRGVFPCDQAVDEFAALLWGELQGLVFKVFQ